MIVAKIKRPPAIRVGVTTQKTLAVRLASLKILAGDAYPLYQGEYEITPKIDGVTVPTAQKSMEKDLRIKEIPYFEVSNPNGKTVYIGKEIE